MRTPGMIWRIIKLKGEDTFEEILGFLFYVLPIALVVLLINNTMGVTDFTKKIPPINSIMCSGLKSEIAKKDEIGRDIWNAYQNEISLFSSNGDAALYDKKISNVARRASQLLTNDALGFLLMKEKAYCVTDIALFEVALDRTSKDFDEVQKYLSGNQLGWNVNYYSVYFPLSQFLK
jgi:hypothetical protein